MGKFEQEYFAKHFKTIDRLIAFRKTFNTWLNSHAGKGIWTEFNHHTWHMSEPNMKGITLDEHNKPTKWIYLTKNKVDKEILRRKQNEKSRSSTTK